MRLGKCRRQQDRRLPSRRSGGTGLARNLLPCQLRFPHRRENREDVELALRRFGLESADEVESKRTVIIPLNITYYPIRVRDNLFLRAAEHLGPHMNARLDGIIRPEYRAGRKY